MLNSRMKHASHCALLFTVIVVFELFTGGVKLSGDGIPQIDPFERYGYIGSFLLYVIRLITFLPLPQVLLNFAGLTFYNAFPDKITLKSSPLLSRASFISIRLVEDCLVEMCTWVRNYIASQEDVTNLVVQDTRIHGVFYATCQAIFYIIAFSHKQLVSQDKGLVLLSSLNLPKIVSCKLNPLRACHPGVVSKFASVTRSYQLAYCYTVIERNSRACLPRLYLDSSGTESIVQVHLDTFFPFDPYTLPKSKKYISSIYREYNEEMVPESESKKDDDNEDDFLESTVNKSLFSYSTSPGFIHYS